MLCELDVTLPPSINVPDQKKGGEGLRHTRDHLTEGTSLDHEITAQGVEARKQKRKKNFTGHSSGVPPKRKTGTKKNETAQPAASDEEEYDVDDGKESSEEEDEEEEEEEEEYQQQEHAKPTKKKGKKTGKGVEIDLSEILIYYSSTALVSSYTI